MNELLVENIPETMALKLAHSAIDDFVRYTERNLVRVYPSGMRIDSSTSIVALGDFEFRGR